MRVGIRTDKFGEHIFFTADNEQDFEILEKLRGNPSCYQALELIERTCVESFFGDKIACITFDIRRKGVDDGK